MVRNAGGIRVANLFWYLEKVSILQKTAYMSKEAFALLYQAKRGIKVDWATMLYDWMQLTGKRDWRQTPAVGRVAPYLAAIFEHVLRVTPVASGLKTPAANALMEEGTLSGSKQRKLLLGSPTIDSKSPFKVSWKDFEEPESKMNFFTMGYKREARYKQRKLLLGSPPIDSKSPFKVSWKDLEEPESKMNFFTMGSESKKSESKGKKITLFPKGIVESAGKSVPKSLLAKEGSSASHGTMGMFPTEEATNCLDDLREMQKISTRLLQEKSDKERLQEEITRLTAKAKAMTTKILRVVEDFQQWVDGLKTVVDEQFKELDEKGMTGVLVADLDVDALKKEVLEYAQEMWNRETKLWREHMAVSTEQFKNWFLCAGQESVRRENEALKIENERLIAEMEEMKNNKNKIEESLSKLKGELSSGLLESDRNLAIEVE
ncbi:hypothetical protein L7F22_035785 [Adiantum nelumboides]|nr:hypothetical protein [Adiantum nelumboides]